MIDQTLEDTTNEYEKRYLEGYRPKKRIYNIAYKCLSSQEHVKYVILFVLYFERKSFSYPQHVFCIISEIFVPKYMSIEFQVADRLMYTVTQIPAVPQECAYQSMTI
jgi:hypothetical protein